jgi:hypothetical protein
MKIADSPYGAIHYTNGELENRAHVGDPVAYRGGAKEGGSLVKFSGTASDPTTCWRNASCSSSRKTSGTRARRLARPRCT